MSALKQAFKRVAGQRGIRLAQRLGRFRFLLKARRVREEGARFRDDPFTIAKFVLLDPETHSYSYDLGNTDELVEFASAQLGAERSDVRAWLAELDADPELHAELRRRTRGRIDAKRRMPLGNRLLWYVVVRAVKPRLIVETGIWDGLGSLMLLRALERNAGEGAEGRLLSIDIDPEAGWLVPSQLAGRWEPVVGDILTDLGPALGDRRVDVFIHDSVHEEDFQHFEFGLALEHAAERLYVLNPNGEELGVLRELASRSGGSHALFVERPAGHFYRPPGTALARFDSLGP